MSWIKKHLLRVILLVVGALAGLAYWYFVGCTSGSCPIKSVWYMSTLFGGIIGYLLGGIIEDFRGKGK
ncbi:MAG: hypothetical protein CSA95_00810 [Bacteroidetes bacterium]|nr:MAG: hypothetical protein CSA95_00810 [Bacteroidota bacterium]PIE88155.1 MAG: hypothetical protein CSA04_03410 [Bacteroidota bacterium]